MAGPIGEILAGALVAALLTVLFAILGKRTGYTSGFALAGLLVLVVEAISEAWLPFIGSLFLIPAGAAALITFRGLRAK
ncbi:MAG: hypothetical protein K2X57_21865 [Xanthobacteraceae bacterium]|nr:hypothetical protein [Xanthobacteraceae bacterium]